MGEKIDIDTLKDIMKQIFDKKMDDFKKDVCLDMTNLKKNICDDMKDLKSEFIALGKEVSESRQAVLLRQEELDGKINTYELAAVQARIDANEAKKVADNVAENTDQKIRDCRETAPARARDATAGTPPKTSWVQVVANMATVIGVAAVLFVVISFSLSTFKATLDKLETVVTRLETNFIAHITATSPGGNH